MITSPPTRPPDGEFRDFGTWVDKATSWIGGRPAYRKAMCFDAKGRRCLSGWDFHRARDEDAFPVRYWFPIDGESSS